MNVSPCGINQLFHGIYEYHDFHGAAMKIIDIHGITITYTIFRPNNSHFFLKLPFSQINSDLKMFFLQSLYFLHQKTTFHWGVEVAEIINTFLLNLIKLEILIYTNSSIQMD